MVDLTPNLIELSLYRVNDYYLLIVWSESVYYTPSLGSSDWVGNRNGIEYWRAAAAFYRALSGAAARRQGDAAVRGGLGTFMQGGWVLLS